MARDAVLRGESGKPLAKVVAEESRRAVAMGAELEGHTVTLLRAGHRVVQIGRHMCQHVSFDRAEVEREAYLADDLRRAVVARVGPRSGRP